MASHHYVSHFHLRQFCDPESLDARDSWLWVGSFADGSVRRRAPKNIGGWPRQWVPHSSVRLCGSNGRSGSKVQGSCSRFRTTSRLAAISRRRAYPHSVPRQLKRYNNTGGLHFITFSCYRRLPLLGAERRRDLFERALETTRRNYGSVIVGYVVMPEHVHLLMGEPRRANVSTAIKALKQGVSRRVLSRMRRRARQPQLFAEGVELKRFWQPRYYDFNVWSEKKIAEKLLYMHRNPVKRGLVQKPEQWHWSSFRHYAFGEAGVVAINVAAPAEWMRAKKALVG